jgi:hypothetical protein
LKSDIKNSAMRDLPCSWFGRINIAKMAILPKAIYVIQCKSQQNPNTILQRHGKGILKFIWKGKKPRTAETILNNKRTARGITFPNLKLYYRAIVTKTAWYWYRDRHIDQWNRIEDPEIKPHNYSHFIFDTHTKNIQWKNEIIFNKWCWSNWLSVCRKMKIDPCLLTCTKIKSKWIKDLNIKPDILTVIEEKVERALNLLAPGGGGVLKYIVNNTNWQPTDLGKNFSSPTYDRGLISKIYKELKKLITKNKTNKKTIKTWVIEKVSKELKRSATL